MGRIMRCILDACFPRFCLSCKEEGSLVCESCKENFDDILKHEGGDHFASFAYGNPLIRNLIKAWKYDFDSSAFGHLKQLGEETLRDVGDLLKKGGVQVIVPLPLSERRERERGFNQSRMIADWVGANCGTEVAELLRREEGRGHQAERTDEERKEAMKESPFIYRGKDVPVSVLLVDDVWTTGATMEAASRILKNAGVQTVLYYTLAKGR
jgi:ComF family protein